jgi:hypothetical protein
MIVDLTKHEIDELFEALDALAENNRLQSEMGAAIEGKLEAVMEHENRTALIGKAKLEERDRIISLMDMLADKVRGEPHDGAPSFGGDYDCGDDGCDFSSGECEHAILCALDRLKIEIMKGQP